MVEDSVLKKELNQPELSIVVPVFDEEAVVETFHQRLTGVLDGLDMESEILYVNDGSRDRSAVILGRLREWDTKVGVINLSRNFGKEIAMTAGLDHSVGEAVVLIDADLQDPPEVIPKLIEQWRDGSDVVYATRVARDGETILKRVSASWFYRVIGRLSHVEIPRDSGDFRLLSRRAVDALGQLREQHRFMKGLFAWIGFRQTPVHYYRDARFSGRSKWNYWRLWNFALEGITSFSTGPLRLASYLGFATALGAFLYATYIVYKAINYGDPVAGYPSMMVVILFLGGVQLMTLGIIGEYVGRMFNESKRRPLYFVDSYRAPRSQPSTTDVPAPEV